MSTTNGTARWKGTCTECHRDGVDVQPRREHGERVKCDRCAAKPYARPSAAGLPDPEPGRRFSRTNGSEPGDTESGGRPKRKAAQTLLPSAPPDEMAAMPEWLTDVLGLQADPVTHAVRYGRHDEARMVIYLASGRRIVFDKQADAFRPEILRRRVSIATDGVIPPQHYKARDVEIVAACVVRLAETQEEADDRAEAAEWAGTFLAGTEAHTVVIPDLSTPEGKYAAVCALNEPRPSTDHHLPIAERSWIAQSAETGDRWVRVGDVAAHVRGYAGRPIGWAQLHGRLIEVGWKHVGEVHRRQPKGTRRVKAHVYEIPGDWEDR